MGRIQSNIGLITGMPIGDTVDSLMALSSKPRDMLQERTDALQEEQVAVLELSALLMMVKYTSDNLGKEDLYEQRQATSSDPAALSATVTGKPPEGTYQYTPLRTVQSQQLLSSGVKSDTAALGGGKLTFRFGDHVQRSASLELLGGGQGGQRGWMRITDRSGVSAEIDLSAAQDVDDVLEAINGNAAINVTAVAHGDRIRLIDNTGQSVSNLKVQEVGRGSTAASLGLAGIDAAASVADGQDVLRLHEELDLDLLSDGNGVHFSSVLPDVEYTLRDGTTGSIDFSAIGVDSSEVAKEVTLGDVLDVINSTDPERLLAEIGPDGDRLVITDLTEGEGTFELSSLYESDALKSLGLDGESADGTITGRRLLGGLKTVLLSSLGGGNGLGTLGALELNDRSGMSDTVNLADAETLEDVIDRINAADVGIVARVNQARTGIELLDTTGGYASNLIVANADGTATADKLGIAVDQDATTAGSGDLHLQVVSYNTRLSDLNGGAGIVRGTLMIRDGNSVNGVVDLSDPDVQTVGDLIQAINHTAAGIYAEINQTGDGIRIVDTTDGEGAFGVYDSVTAESLHLARPPSAVEIDGQSAMVVDGSMTHTIELDADDSLDDLRQKINELNVGVTATTFVDGSSRPFRLSLASNRPGEAGALVFDTSEIDLSLQETVRAEDALLVFGDARAAATSILISSSTNTFDSVLSGTTLEIHRASSTPVTIGVGTSDVDLVANVQTMVDNYNRFRERLNELTAYDLATGATSVLTSDATALRLDTDLSYIMSGRFFGAGQIQSLGEIGIGLTETGTLTFDDTKLKGRFADDPEAVRDFFSKEQFGVSAKLGKLVEQLSGQDVSLLARRFTTLGDKIDRNEERIEFLNDRLDVQRDRLFLDFYRMEIAIGKLQNNLTALGALQSLAPLTDIPRAEMNRG